MNREEKIEMIQYDIDTIKLSIINTKYHKSDKFLNHSLHMIDIYINDMTILIGEIYE